MGTTQRRRSGRRHQYWCFSTSMSDIWLVSCLRFLVSFFNLCQMLSQFLFLLQILYFKELRGRKCDFLLRIITAHVQNRRRNRRKSISPSQTKTRNRNSHKRHEYTKHKENGKSQNLRKQSNSDRTQNF